MCYCKRFKLEIGSAPTCKLNSNVHFQKIRAVYVTNPEKYTTLEDIVVAEREAHGAEWPKIGATLALMWLKR